MLLSAGDSARRRAVIEDLQWLRNGSEDLGDGREDRPRMHVFAVSTDPETTLASIMNVDSTSGCVYTLP